MNHRGHKGTEAQRHRGLIILEILNIYQRNQFRFQKLCFEHTLVINLLFSVSLRHAQDRLSASVVKIYE